MNALQTFLQTKEFGFLKVEDMPELIALDRLFPVLVRCDMCRFECAAQDCAHLIKAVQAIGDYVRDVSAPVGSDERAANWQPEGKIVPVIATARKAPDRFDRPRTLGDLFNDGQIGGNFDGFIVGSDADPGL